MSVGRNNASGHVYGSTVVNDRATAFLGDVHGNVKIENTYVLQNTAENKAESRCLVERHNYVYRTHTLERITRYDESDNSEQRGTSRLSELRWERRELLGIGNYGEVYREECTAGELGKNRAVKILWLSQLRRQRIDIMKEIGALAKLSHVRTFHCPTG